MVKLLMILQHITLCISCIIFILVSHTCIFVINNVEPKCEKPPESAPVEDANPELDQGKPRYI
jgi:hypothetical protein